MLQRGGGIAHAVSRCRVSMKFKKIRKCLLYERAHLTELGCCGGAGRRGECSCDGACVHRSGVVHDVAVCSFELFQVLCAETETVVVCVREVLQMADEQCAERVANAVCDLFCDAVALQSHAAVAVRRRVEVVRLGVSASELAIFDVVKQTTTTLVARLKKHVCTRILRNVRINERVTFGDPQEIRQLFQDNVQFWDYFTSVAEDFGVGVQSWFAAAGKQGDEVANCVGICHLLHLVLVNKLCHFIFLHLNFDEHVLLHCCGRINLIQKLFLRCSIGFY